MFEADIVTFGSAATAQIDGGHGIEACAVSSVQTALEVGLTELDTIEHMMAPIEAAKSAARAFCTKVITYAG